MKIHPEKAAEELQRRGWSIDDEDDAIRRCPRCASEYDAGDRFCRWCGERLPVGCISTLEDLEAAILAALGEEAEP